MVDYSLLDKAVNDNKRLSAENTELKRQLSVLKDYLHGDCNWCNRNNCHDSCIHNADSWNTSGDYFEWRGIDEPPKMEAQI